MDFSKIIENSKNLASKTKEPVVREKPKEKLPPPDFVDDDEVPPLE